MSTAYENLTKHLELAIRQLKEILDKEKNFKRRNWLITQIISAIWSRICYSKGSPYSHGPYRDQGSPRKYSKSDVEDYVQPKG